MSVSLQCTRCGRRSDAPLADGLCAVCSGTRTWAAAHTGPHLGETASFASPEPTTETPPAETGTSAATVAAFPAARFEVLGALGRGGMGTVWKVRERATGSVFALKTLQAQSGPSAGGRFRIEAQALTRLRHPNIVQVHEIDLEDDAPYFTMELVEGGSLEDRVRRDGPLPPAEAAGLAEAIARAAAHAHRAGVLHRDIKPANVLLTPSGDVKVSDFGLAKRLDRADGRTATLTSLGTPGYMAPEQVSRKFGPMGPATDVYGIGATLYRLLTGKPTVDTAGKDTVQVLAECATVEVPDPRAARPDLPPDLATICRKCLQKEPGDRYPDAGALAEDLSLWLAGHRPRGRLPSWARRAGRATLRRWPALVGGLLVLGLVGVTITLAALRKPKAPPGPDEVLARLRGDLRAGQAVVVPERGLPAWENWALGKSAFGESPLNDGTCAFQALGTSVVDLFVPDMDRYRVSVDLREIRTLTPPGSGSALIGLAFGRQERTLADGTRVQTFLAVRYADHVHPDVAKVNGKARAQLSTMAIVQVPGQSPNERAPGVARAAEFEPTKALNGEWRRILAEVTPDGVRVRWQPRADAAPEDLARLTTDDLNTRFADVLGRLPDAPRREPAAAPSTWDPKGALGIYCRQTWVGVRNLVVESLPEE